MERMRVKSGSLRAIGYNESEQILEIEFHHGGIYRYFGVSKKVYDGLMNSQSSYGKYNKDTSKTGIIPRKTYFFNWRYIHTRALIQSKTISGVGEGEFANHSSFVV